MGRTTANQALRAIETLYASGPIGDLSDAQLVERFLRRDGRERLPRGRGVRREAHGAATFQSFVSVRK